MLLHKTYGISLTMWDWTILSKFSTPRVFKKYTWALLKKLLKNDGHFEFFGKIYAISITVQGRAILSKFSNHKLKQYALSNGQKNFLSNMVAILNFRILFLSSKCALTNIGLHI